MPYKAYEILLTKAMLGISIINDNRTPIKGFGLTDSIGTLNSENYVLPLVCQR